MSVDADTASVALGGVPTKVTKALCTSDLDIAGAALQEDGTTLIACGQMANLFEELVDELGVSDSLATVDIRDRAGWTDTPNAHAKQAALLAEAVLPRPVTPSRTMARCPSAVAAFRAVCFPAPGRTRWKSRCDPVSPYSPATFPAMPGRHPGKHPGQGCHRD